MEDCINIPRGLLRNDQTVSMDFGSSLAKIVWPEYGPAECKFLHLRMISFPREDIEGIMYCLRPHMNSRRLLSRKLHDPVDMDFTGLGSVQYMHRLQKDFHIKLHLTFEWAMMARALVCLVTHVPVKDLVHPRLVSELLEPRNSVADHAAMYKQAVTSNSMPGLIMDFTLVDSMMQSLSVPAMDPERPMVDSCHVFPSMIAIFGSALACMKVEKNGAYTIIDTPSFGGKGLFGKAKAFLGVTTFEEFLALAEEGVSKNVDLYCNDLLGGSAVEKMEEEESIYDNVSSRDNDLIAFNFGKAANHAPGHRHARADLAHSLLLEDIMVMAQTVFANAQLAEVQHVFVTGSLAQGQFVRRMIASEMTRKQLMWSLYNSKKTDIQLHFLTCGSHLAAIGNLIRPCA